MNIPPINAYWVTKHDSGWLPHESELIPHERILFEKIDHNLIKSKNCLL